MNDREKEIVRLTGGVLPADLVIGLAKRAVWLTVNGKRQLVVRPEGVLELAPWMWPAQAEYIHSVVEKINGPYYRKS